MVKGRNTVKSKCAKMEVYSEEVYEAMNFVVNWPINICDGKISQENLGNLSGWIYLLVQISIW